MMLTGRGLVVEDNVGVLVTSIVAPPAVIGAGFDGFISGDQAQSSSTIVVAGSGNQAVPGGSPTTIVYITATTSSAADPAKPTAASDPVSLGSASILAQIGEPLPSKSAGGLPSSESQTASGTRHGNSSSPPATPTIPHQSPTSPESPKPGISHVAIVPIVGTIVPVVSIIVFSFLFCCWYRKKRIRDRQLDDLERSAIWVNGLSEVDPASKDTTQTQTGKKEGVEGQYNDRNRHDQQGNAKRSPLPVDRSRARMSPACTFRSQTGEQKTEQHNPFETSIDEDNESVRSSQIDLAITTSTQSCASSDSSTATVIKHDTTNNHNPFISNSEGLDSEQSPLSPTLDDMASTEDVINEDRAVSEVDQVDLARIEGENCDGSTMLRCSTDTVIYSPKRPLHER